MTERIQKFIARSGVFSRRGAETALLQGRITLNGQRVTELGTQVDPSVDRVEIDGRPITSPLPAAQSSAGPTTASENPEGRAPTLVLLHKPRQVMTTRDDPEGRKTVMDLLPPTLRALKPVGRLDFDSEGLLLLTDDGDLMLRLTHPRYEIPKRYWVQVQGVPTQATLRKLATGVPLEDGPGRFLQVKLDEKAVGEAARGMPKATLDIRVAEGRNRFIRRMLEAVGHPVLRLRRLEMGPFSLGALQPGQHGALDPANARAARALVMAMADRAASSNPGATDSRTAGASPARHPETRRPSA